jgi:outer membrane protein TolC
MRLYWLWVVALLSAPALAADAALTLDEALRQADAAHPDLDAARSRADIASAEMLVADSLNDFRVTLEASLRTGRNPAFQNEFQDDNALRLSARKTLYDFGRQTAGREAAREESVARGLQLMDARAQRRIAIMARYFDVLLADMQYAAETEYLAVAYTSWDNAKDRADLGQLAGWQMAELEGAYLDTLARRNDTRRKLREKRQLLAAAMNQAGPLPNDLVDPELKGKQRPLPDYETLLAAMREHNPRLQAHKRLLLAASERLAGVRAQFRPSLEMEAEAASWSRQASTRDELRAGMNFVWPMWQGGRQDASLVLEQARFHALQAESERLHMDLQQELLSIREELDFLRDTGRRQTGVDSVRRDMDLERARAEYEMELKTNIGTAMAETQMARLRSRSVEYRLALAWARLDALLGVPVESILRETQP